MKRRELLRALPAAALAMAGATTLIAAARPRIVHLTAKRFVFGRFHRGRVLTLRRHDFPRREVVIEICNVPVV